MVIINGGSDIPDLPPPPPPEPAPDEPLAPSDWPWPLNLLEDWLRNTFAWAVDTIKYWVDDLGGDITEFFQGLDSNLTNLGDWLKSQIDNGIRDSQTFISGVIKANQDRLQTSITDTQAILKEATDAGVGGLDALIKGTQKTLDDGIKGVQSEINLQVSTVQKTIEEAVDPDRGIIPTLIREVPEAIFTLANTTIGPILKGLNDLLEEV